MHRPDAFGDPLVGVFDHHDGAVDEHADGEDQAEHDDVGDRVSEACEHREGQQERGRDGEADEQGRAHAERGKHHDHHQRDRRDDRAFELRDHRGDLVGAVVGDLHLDRVLQRRGPGGFGRGDDAAHLGGGVDQVVALALDHLQRDRGVAVEARGAGAVFEGQADLGEFAQRHHPVAVDLDRERVDVGDVVEGRRDLDRVGAGRRGHLACGDQLVVLGHHRDQLGGGDVVGLEPERVDDHFQHLVAVACELGLEHGVDALDLVLQVLGEVDEAAFGHVAGEVDDEDREL